VGASKSSKYIDEEEAAKKLKYGIGKRMNLAEILLLYKYTK
jgi:hypothetical protein